ncbi:MAG: hypothetical protein MJE12_14525 [Alphaproteobacteria bacterium]|nr:hypothetical protein [Alphaproteobacteria bacterium]
MMAGKRSDIDIGDQFRKNNSTNWLWQVTEIVTPGGHEPHARLVRVNFPSDARMFAVAALKDRRLFAAATDSKRRITEPMAAQ